MSKAWQILLALTFARMTMAAQFQSIPALAPWLTAEGGLSFIALGTLTGAYLLPGALVAMAGGWLGQTVGDARVAIIGLALMTLGGFAGWWVSSFETALTWRVVAGVGAVSLNVMLTKMAADWFDGRDDLPSAMGVLVSSWPAGIALAALCLPIVAAGAGLGLALLVPAILCATGLVALALIWRAPERPAAASTDQAARFTARELVLVFIAGMIWALYNVAFIGTIVWTPDLLISQGVGPVAAHAVTSFIGWVAIFSVAAGGWMAARGRHKDLPALVCFLLSAVLIGAMPFMGAQAGSLWVMCVVGAALGPAAAMTMTLPVEAARSHLRAMAMGIYFAIYYGLMGLGPVFFGALRDVSENPAAPHGASAVLLLGCVVLWAVFRKIQNRPL